MHLLEPSEALKLSIGILEAKETTKKKFVIKEGKVTVALRYRRRLISKQTLYCTLARETKTTQSRYGVDMEKTMLSLQVGGNQHNYTREDITIRKVL
ncbi:hypothetical protein LXL04_031236 [Taraxacum kok-saghyz]